MERGIRLPQSPSEWGFKGANYLLVIGIDKYLHWKPLNNAVRDVQDIARLLTQRYQFEPDNVITLFNEEATEDNIREKLMWVKKNITPDDNLIVFFSGHGHYDEDLEEGYWVPANARPNSASDYISNSDVLKWIKSIKTHHTLLVVDSCFSGTLVSQNRSEILSEKYPSCRIFASGRKELVEDGSPGTNSPFAKALLSKLKHNTDRVIRASDVIHHVTKSVESSGGQSPIEGRIRDGGDQGGEFVFHLKITEAEIWDAVTASNDPAEYLKYIEYFPDGKFAIDARNKLSQLTDADDWAKASSLNTTLAYTQYLESHPKGTHAEEAIRCMEELDENEVWQTAKTRNNVSAYMDYLRKYPTGRFDTLARRNLDQLRQNMHQADQDLVRDELEVMENKSSVEQDKKDQFKKLVSDAESAYSNMQYPQSISLYRKAIEIHQPHFVPNKNFLAQRIELAEKRIGYGEHYADGEQALKAGNYDLAIEFFKKAQSYEDNGQVRNAIIAAQRKGVVVGPPPTPVIKPKAKSSSRVVYIVIGILVLAGVAYGIITATGSSSSPSSTTSYLPEDNSTALTNPPADVDPQVNNGLPAQKRTTQKPTPQENTFTDPDDTHQQVNTILGGWTITSIEPNTPSAEIQANTLLNSRITFFENGVVSFELYNMVDNGNWSLRENQLLIQFSSGPILMTILDLQSYTMVWSGPAVDGSQMVFYLQR